MSASSSPRPTIARNERRHGPLVVPVDSFEIPVRGRQLASALSLSSTPTHKLAVPSDTSSTASREACATIWRICFSPLPAPMPPRPGVVPGGGPPAPGVDGAELSPPLEKELQLGKDELLADGGGAPFDEANCASKSGVSRGETIAR